MSDPTPDPSSPEPATASPAPEAGPASPGPAVPPPPANPAYGPPTGAPFSVTPPRPNPVLATLRSLTVRDRIVAVVAGVGAYAVAYLVGVVSLLLTVAVAAASGSASGSGSGSSSGLPTGGLPTPSVSDALGAIGNIFAGPAQLISLADLGRLEVSGAVSIVVPVTGSFAFGVVPVFVGLAQLLTLLLVARFAGRRDQPFRVRLAASLITGLVLAIISLVLGAVLAFRIPATNGLSIGAISATTVGSVFVAFLVGVAATLLARPGWLLRLHPVLGVAFGTLRVAASHLGALVVVSGIVVLIASAVSGSAGVGAALPLFLGNLAIVLAAVSMFGSASPSDFLLQVAQSISGSRSATGNTSASVLTGPASLWFLVVFAVLLAVVAGLALAVRRGTVVRRGMDWALTPAVYLVLGIVGLVLGTAVVSIHIATINGDGSVGITPWFPLILALWGGAIETVARFVAPRVLAVTPPAITGVVARLVGSDAAALAGWTPRARPATAGAPADPADAVPGAVAAEGVAPAPAGLPAHQPLSPRARRILIRSSIIGGAAIVLIVGLSIAAGVLRSTVYGPGTSAQGFVQAIADGDATKAGSLAQIDGMGGGMLTDQVLQSATDRISGVTLGSVQQNGDNAAVSLTYMQGGAAQSTTLQLTRVSTSWLIQDQWRVTSSLTGDVEIGAPQALEGADITANGVSIGKVQHTGKNDYTAQSFPAFPGSYTIAIAGTDYLTVDAAPVTVTEAGGKLLHLEAKPTDKLTADATKLVQDTITSCAARTDKSLPSECPFSGPSFSQTSSVTYTVTKMPELEVQVRDDGTVGVESTSAGSVDEKYDYDTGFGSFPEEYSSSIYVLDVFTIVDGKLQRAGTSGS